jgi:hypothetical protein
MKDVKIKVKEVGDGVGMLNEFIVSHHKGILFSSTLKVLDATNNHLDQESQAIIDWLSPLNFFPTQTDTLHRRENGTGEWLFKTPEFKAWLSRAEKILWCSGLRIPTLLYKQAYTNLHLAGAGKTILAYYHSSKDNVSY